MQEETILRSPAVAPPESIYGDTTRRLRIFVGDKLTPAQFESHSARGQPKKKWKSCIWVLIKDKKVPLCKTALLKYYKETWEGENGRSRPKGAIHRDEFIRCSSCNKERRFSLRTKEECRIHHEASINKHWTCADRVE
ncbi:protein ULTRAPETALA 1-like [Vitis riparia]|uniref:protein ULTRAPETALA 1-like n=1 Tax=Vitis riparia TaxID=96939 RepID=UPI00155AD3A9|nr:protein ULTRAPETALA 1-like [Vitis riparia]